MKTKSDPYVEVRLCPKGDEHPADDKILLGKTVPKMKTLSPVWDQTFSISLPRNDLNELAKFELTIMDYDRGNDDDLMGIVQVNIPISRPGSHTKWYGVPATSAGGEEASGRVQCTLNFHSGSKTKEELQAQKESRILAAGTKVDQAVRAASAAKLGQRVEFADLKRLKTGRNAAIPGAAPNLSDNCAEKCGATFFTSRRAPQISAPGA